MVAPLDHIGGELVPLARVVIEDPPLARGVQVAREQDPHAAVVDPQQDAVAVRVLAVAPEILERGRGAVLFDRTEDADGRRALPRTEPREVLRLVAQPAHGASEVRHGLHEVPPMAL